MSIKLPHATPSDRILNLLGKQRAVYVPSDTESKFGPHMYKVLRKESFWSALFRGKDVSLPEGLVYLDDINLEGNSHNKG